MDELQKIQQFLKDSFESTRWYHERSEEQRDFDNAVTAYLRQGNGIEEAVSEAVRHMPGMKVILAGKTVPELTDYYERLHRLEREIALADTMNQIVALTKRKAAQGRSNERN